MNRSDPQAASETSLLQAAQAAIESRDLQRADALYREHIAKTPTDACGLASYGIFCLRTGRAETARYLLHKSNALQPGDIDVLVPLGYAQLEVEDFDAAQSAFESAVAIARDNSQAQYGLGLCLRHRGEWSAAAAAFAVALAGQSGADALPILLNLADACEQAGNREQARMHFVRAQRMAPDHPAVLLAHGKFLRACGEATQAVPLIDRCLQASPDEPVLLLEMARCLRALGDAPQAMRLLARLEQRVPGMPECYEEFGSWLQGPDDGPARDLHWATAIDIRVGKGELDAAEALLDRLLAANPASALGWNSRGILENARHRLDSAEAAYLKAIGYDPRKLNPSANLALLYENTNRIDEAKSIGENVVGYIVPGEQPHAAIELLSALAKVARRQKDYRRAMEILDRIAALGPSPKQRMFVEFERARLQDLLDDAPAAIRSFESGNALAHATWLRMNPGTNKASAGVDYMLDLVGKGWLRQWKPIKTLPDSANLAFLIGFPRSGTTLLNHVLDGHEAIQAMEEKPPVSKMLDAVRNMPNSYPHALADCDALDVEWLRETYFRSAAEHGAPDRSRLILDKFPMHTNLAAMLHRVFPEARFVFALRHPCDVVLSCFMQNFELNNTMANFCTLADTVAMYTRTMDLWQMYRQQLPLEVHTVRYEDVVDDFDHEVRALCDFLGVPWKDELREFDAKALQRGRINTPSYEQVSQPIYRQARYRWERYREQLAPYLPILQPYVERFGYSIDIPAAADRTG